jgi:FkbM family methyltransferase
MAVLDTAIHAAGFSFTLLSGGRTWMTGSSPVMTMSSQAWRLVCAIRTATKLRIFLEPIELTDELAPQDDERFGPLISFAQNFEDVMLWRALQHVTPGFYIDIGAQDPVTDSVSFAFYKKSWRGVHVEPTQHYADRLRAARPDETVIQSAIAAQAGMLRFYEVEETGLSTGDAEIAETHRLAGHTVHETSVPAITLDALLDGYADRDIHWLKIDVEGLEQQVIDSWAKSKVRPWILVVECTVAGTEDNRSHEWEKQLEKKGYSPVYFDGLNRYFLAKDHADLAKHFVSGPNCFDDFVYSGDSTNRFCLVLTRRIAWLQHGIDYRDTILADRAAQAAANLALRDEELAKAKAHVEQMSEWVASLHERHNDALADTVASHLRANQALARAAELEPQVRELERLVAATELHLSQVLASGSWRITRPLRVLSRMVGRLRGQPQPAAPQMPPPVVQPQPEPAPPEPVIIAPAPSAPAPRKMRLVIDLQGAQGENGGRGIGRYSLATAEALIRRAAGREVIVVLNGLLAERDASLFNRLCELLPRHQVKIWTPPADVSFEKTERRSQRERAENLREAFIASLKPDAVYITSLFDGLWSDTVTSIGRAGAGRPTAATLYDLIPYIHPEIYLDPYHTTREWYQRKLDDLRRADLLVAISESSRQEVIQHLGFAPDQVIVAPAAVDDSFTRRELSRDQEMTLRDRLGLNKPFLLNTGGIDPRKNVEMLIEAFAALPASLRDGYQLAVVCALSDKERDRLRRLGTAAGLPADALVLTGRQSDEDLIALYNLCHLFVFPSWHEGFGLPALEAMACGAAVIAADATSLPEVMGRADAMFPARDGKALTAKIAELLSNETLRQELKDYGPRQAANFTWDKAADAAWQGFDRLPGTVRHQRPRLAFVSPLPPARSGIADYSAELLPELSRHYRIDVIAGQDEVSDPWVRANCTQRSPEWFKAHAGDYDRILYHFGNSSFHRYMFALLEQHPGVVVLHDFYLSGVIADAEWGHGETHAWSKALYASHGYGPLAERFTARSQADVVFKYPCTLPVLRQAEGVIVHSHFPQRLMREWYGAAFDAKLEVIPLLRQPAGETDRIAARRKLGLPEDQFIVCSFGIMGPIKQNDRLLAAWRQSETSKSARLIFAGENDPGDYGRSMAGAEITGFLSAEDYRLYLQAADLAVQLRTLSRGETSAAVLDCMNYGLPLIVNAHGAMADLPGDCVWKLPDRFTDAELAAAIDAARQDADERKRRGARGRQEIRQNHAPRPIADLYAAAIEGFQRLAVPQWDEIGEAAALTFPPAQPLRQLLVDVSELIKADAKTGIQRVVRNILRELLANPPDGFRVEPVYADIDHGYRYARQFTLQFIGLPADMLEDEELSFAAGDHFLGLDLQPVVIPRRRDFFRRLRLHGVRVEFVVYDLLCIERPDCFDKGSAELFIDWLQAVADNDGATCISATVAESLRSWIAANRPERLEDFRIGHFQLGSEFTGVSASAEPLVPNGPGPLILMVGTIEPRKGYRSMLDAVDKLWGAGAEFRLAIVGKIGWLVEHLVERLNKHPELKHKLYWFETADDSQLSRLYHDADGMILASEGEGFGLPLIEAGHYDLPILARDLPVFREVAGNHARYFGEDLAGSIKSWLGELANDTAPRSGPIGGINWHDSMRQLMASLDLTPPPAEPATIERELAAPVKESASPLQLYAGYEAADIELLRNYATEAATVLDNLLVDGFGTMTPRENVGFCNEFRPDRLQFPVPDDGFHAETIEYVSLIDALERAPQQRFSVVEIGAAWGPWLSMGGVVARRSGRKQIDLVGVEADPDRFQQLNRQLVVNQLRPAYANGEWCEMGPARSRLIQGAAGAKPGTLWFPKLNIHDLGAAAAEAKREQDYRGAAIESYEVRAYSLTEILDGVDFVDFLHVDIQGAEFDLLSANAELLKQRVGCMLIGTHSRVIEGQLIQLLDRDWSLWREKPCRVDWQLATPDLSGRTVNDGVQYWRRK